AAATDATDDSSNDATNDADRTVDETPASPRNQTTATHYAQRVLADEPAAYWRFEEPEGAQSLSAVSGSGAENAALAGTLHKQAAAGVDGPRAPEFPPFDPEIRAVDIPGDGSFVRIADPGAD